MSDFYGAGAAGYAPTVIQANSANRNLIKWMGAIAFALIALLFGLLTLLLIGVGTGVVGLLTGFVLATLPVPIYITLVLWIDRYEPEPFWTLALAFAWGGLVATFIAFVVNTLNSVIVAAVVSARAGELFGTVVSAPIVEESAKGALLFGLFIFKRDEFDGVVDGVVYASMVALGFAMTENIQYYGAALVKGGGVGVGATFILRGVMSPFAHPLFTSMTGIGIGLASQTRNALARFTLPFVGLGTAIFFHFLWNLSASINGLLYFAVYFLVMMPVFVAVLVAVFFALRREGRIVRDYLLCDLQRGSLTKEDYERLCTIRGRMGASYAAFSRGGVAAWRARMQYNNVASELAFHRARIAKGLAANDAQAAAREAAYARLLTDLRSRCA